MPAKGSRGKKERRLTDRDPSFTGGTYESGTDVYYDDRPAVQQFYRPDSGPIPNDHGGAKKYGRIISSKKYLCSHM